MAVVTICIWVIVGTMFVYIAVPTIAVAAIILFFYASHYKSYAYKCSAMFFINLFLSPLYIVLVSIVASFLLSSTLVYNIGFDVQTPDGIVSIANEVTVVDRINPIRSLKKYYSGYSSVQGNSNYLKLNNNKILITSLSPLGSNTISFLQIMPKWIRQADVQIKTENGILKYMIPANKTPVMVFLDDVGNPQTITIVTRDSFPKIVGPGYSLIGAWITFDDIEFKNSLSVDELWNLNSASQTQTHLTLKSLDIPQDRFSIHWESAPSFLRI
ncbi:hypothetical protein [Pseudodesulfovibrio sp. S3]|uniref:hypothetical protein n=2 Tax=unclassified Pseudodesulfovibrio TaxID=2661612 RepID=UPI0013E330CC|nr:hypothetical protein [Pseudodesulfovibrio sp. S3]MCJ2163448.1 hypothetical protein [Pseudodesulfovibrio sp. S3-i]